MSDFYQNDEKLNISFLTNARFTSISTRYSFNVMLNSFIKGKSTKLDERLQKEFKKNMNLLNSNIEELRYFLHKHSFYRSYIYINFKWVDSIELKVVIRESLVKERHKLKLILLIESIKQKCKLNPDSNLNLEIWLEVYNKSTTDKYQYNVGYPIKLFC